MAGWLEGGGDTVAAQCTPVRNIITLASCEGNSLERQHIQGREAIFFERYTELPDFVQFNSNDC